MKKKIVSIIFAWIFLPAIFAADSPSLEEYSQTVLAQKKAELDRLENHESCVEGYALFGLNPPEYLLAGDIWKDQWVSIPSRIAVIKLEIESLETVLLELSHPFTVPASTGSYIWDQTKDIRFPGDGTLVFEAKAAGEIQVCVAKSPRDQSSMYEVVIGSRNNTEILIKKAWKSKDQGCAVVNVNQNPQAAVNVNQWTAYWVSVNRGWVKVGKAESPGENILLTWLDPKPLQSLKKIGFSSGSTPVEYRNVRVLPAVK